MFYGLTSDADVERLRRCLTDLMEIFGTVYAADELIAIRRNAGFLSDQKLRRGITDALAPIADAAIRHQAESKTWRLHTLTWAARSALAVPGDFVECGAFDGFSAAVVMSFVAFAGQDRSYYIYDSFCGLSPQYASDDEMEKNRFYEAHSDAFEICTGRFRGMPNVHIVQGFLPEALSAEAPQCIALLHLDLNCARAEHAVLEALFDRIATGGMLVLDDYGKQIFRAQKDAADAFLSSRGHQALELPTGQGLVVKRASP
jgi:hypothetical protein